MRPESALAFVAFAIIASSFIFIQPAITGLQVACTDALCGDAVCTVGCEENSCPSDCSANATVASPVEESPGQAHFFGFVLPGWDDIRPFLDNQSLVISAAATLLFFGIVGVLLLRMRRIEPIKNPRPPVYSLILTPPRPEIKPEELQRAMAEKQTMQIRHTQKLQHREAMFTPFEHRPPPPESALMRELRSLPSFEDEQQRRKAMQDLSRLAKPSIGEQRKR